jgi:hypothetical protein
MLIVANGNISVLKRFRPDDYTTYTRTFIKHSLAKPKKDGGATLGSAEELGHWIR